MRVRSRQTQPQAASDQTRSSVPINEDQMKQLRRYRFSYRERVSSGISGEHRSTRRGPSPEFADYRAYVHGDDFRRIDWNAYARLNHLFIKESEITTERDVVVLIDAGPTMDWHSDRTSQTKLQVATQLAAALGYVALWHFDRLSIQRLGVAAEREYGPVQGRSNILPMFQFCGAMQASRAASPEDVWRAVRARKRAGKLVIMSDFLWADLDAFRTTLANAAARQWQTTLILLEDEAEIDPSHLFDSGINLEINPLDARDRMQVSGSGRSLQAYETARDQWLHTFLELDRMPAVATLRIPTDDSSLTATMQRLFDLGVLER